MYRKTFLYSCITFAWILSSLIALDASANPECNSTFDLDPNTVLRSSAPLEAPTFRWHLPSTGIATVDLLTDESSSAWIDVLAHACGEQAAEIFVIEQSSRHLVLAVRSAGPIYLAASSPSLFRLIASFTQAEVIEEAFDFGHSRVPVVQTSFLIASSVDKVEPVVVDPEPDSLVSIPVDKVEPVVVDPEPDSLRAVGNQLVASFLIASSVDKVEPVVVDPDSDSLVTTSADKVEPVVVDPEPDSFAAISADKVEPVVVDPEPDSLTTSNASGIGPAPSQVLLFEPICYRTERDDHGDTMSCATPLTFGNIVTGELANDWSDDSDVFSFRLSKVTKVEIVMAFEAPDVNYELSGSTGQRLAVDRLATHDSASRHLVSTLSPGRYFFRVTGPSGVYAINLNPAISD